MQQQESATGNQDPLEQFQLSLQTNIFMVVTQLLHHIQHFSPWVFYLIESLEAIQLLRFSLHPVLNYQDSALGYPFVKTVLNHLSVDYLIKQYPEKLAAFFALLAVPIVGYGAAIAAVWYYTEKPKNHLNIWEFLIGFCNILTLIIVNLLVIPVTELICNVFLCTSSTWLCYDATYTIYMGLSIILAIIILISLTIYSLLFYIKNPFNRSFLSKPSNISRLIKAAIKITAASYLTVDTKGTYQNVYIYGYAVVLGGYLFLFRDSYQGQEKYFYFGYFCEIGLFLFSLTTIMQYYVSEPGIQELSLFYTVMCSVPLCYAVRQIDILSKKNLLLDSFREKSSESAQQFVRELIQATQNCREQNTQILLLSTVRLIHSSCQASQNCACLLYLNDFKPSTKQSIQKHRENVYKFIEYVLKQNTKSYPKDIYFRLALMYLLYFRMNSKISSMLVCNEAAECKTSLSEKFELYLLRMQFKQQAKKEDTFMDGGFAELNSYLAFSESFMQLQDDIELCAQKSIELWFEMAQDNPSLLRLSSISAQIHRLYQKVDESYELCNIILPFSLKAISIYAYFLLNVVQSPEAYSKSSHLIISLSRHDHQTNLQARRALGKTIRKSCILTVGATKGIVGTILSCNSQVKQLFGYDRWQLIGQKINKIMPKIYHNTHDKMLKSFVQQEDKYIRPKRVRIPTLNQKGFLIMCDQLFKITSSENHGFQFISFLSQEKEQSLQATAPNYVIYSQPSCEIEAMSQIKLERCNTIERLPIFIIGTNIALMFPKTDLNGLAETGQKEFINGAIDKRLFTPGITREELELLDCLQSGEYDLPVKLCIEKVSTIGDIRIKRIKFYIKDSVKFHRSISSQVIFNTGLEKLEKELEVCKLSGQQQAALKKITNYIQRQKLGQKLKFLSGLLCFSLLLWLGTSFTSLSRSLDQAKLFSSSLSDLNRIIETSVLTGNIMFDALMIIKATQLNLTGENMSIRSERLSNDLEILSKDLKHLSAMSHLEMPSDTFEFFNGDAHLTLLEGLSQLIYSGVRLSHNFSTQSDLYYIERNSPVRIPLLLNVALEQEIDFLQGHLRQEEEVRSLLMIIIVGITILAGVVFVLFVVRIFQFKRNIVGILNCLEIESVKQIRERCEGFMLSFFELNPIIKTVKNNKEIVFALKQLADKEDRNQMDDDNQEIPLFQPYNSQEPQQKLIRPITLLSIKSKPYIVFAYIMVFVILLSSFFIERQVNLTPGFYIREFNILSQMVRNNKQLSVYACLAFLEGKYQMEFYETAKTLYASTELFYSFNTDDGFYREIIYGQVEAIKAMLDIQKNYPGKVSFSEFQKSALQLDIVQSGFAKQSSEHLDQINYFMQDTYSTIARLKCIIELVIFLAIFSTIWRLLFRQLKNRCDSLIGLAQIIPESAISQHKSMLQKLEKYD